MRGAKGRGSKREHAVAVMLRDDGYVVYRSAGSHGCADLVAMRADLRDVVLVQVKSSAQGPYEHFGPGERALLIDEAERAGAKAVLCWWPPRGELRWIDATDWPRNGKLVLA